MPLADINPKAGASDSSSASECHAATNSVSEPSASTATMPFSTGGRRRGSGRDTRPKARITNPA